MAFQDHKASLGLLKSPFVGLKHFRKFLTDYNFKTIFSNTLIISFYSLIAGFPLPIIFALFTNTIKNRKFKNLIKTVSYAPHFISTVVIVAMINLFFAPTSGVFTMIYNNVRSLVGGGDFRGAYEEIARQSCDWMMNGGIEEEWDTYLENLDEIGLQRWLEINEQAVERYNNQ